MERCFITFLALTFLFSFKNEVLARSPLKIVNGTTTDDGEFPYLVQLLDNGDNFLCGGGIIGPEWILTAGQCAEDGQVTAIIYGTNKLWDDSEISNTTITVKNWFQHPNFTRTDANIPIYDVGILQLEYPIPLGEKAQVIKLVEANATIPFHVQGVLSGWGVNETWAGQAQPYLQKIYLQLLTGEECKAKIDGYIGYESFLPTHNLCSDDYYNGECYGDSGSPFVINGTHYGPASWSYKPCGIVPGTYSRISNPEYRNWIKNVTNI